MELRKKREERRRELVRLSATLLLVEKYSQNMALKSEKNEVIRRPTSRP